jgi:hypothetical protein
MDVVSELRRVAAHDAVLPVFGRAPAEEQKAQSCAASCPTRSTRTWHPPNPASRNCQPEQAAQGPTTWH